MVALSALMVLSACGNKDKMKKPETLLSEEQMVDILFDSYLIEAELNHRKAVGENVGSLQEDYYRELFEHYGISDSIFDVNMEYYTHQLSTLERIMDSVNSRFQQAQPQQ